MKVTKYYSPRLNRESGAYEIVDYFGTVIIPSPVGMERDLRQASVLVALIEIHYVDLNLQDRVQELADRIEREYREDSSNG